VFTIDRLRHSESEGLSGRQATSQRATGWQGSECKRQAAKRERERERERERKKKREREKEP
jgi:hypothetical protein